MISPARGVAFYNKSGQMLWLYPTLCLVGYRLDIPAGEDRIGYQMEDHDFVSGEAQIGDILTLASATLIEPGGEVLIYNDQLDKPRHWTGSLKPIANGIHIKGNVKLVGVKDSVMRCVSPRNNMKGFHDKTMQRVHLDKGQSLTLGENVIGFVVVYGEPIVDGYPAYFAEAGDVYTATEDSVIAVVYRKEVDNAGHP